MTGIVEKNLAARAIALLCATSLSFVGLSLSQAAKASHQPTFLQIEPETDTGPNGGIHALTATFRDEAGAPIQLSEEQLVDFEVISGPNSNLTNGFRDFECPSNNPTQGATCRASYRDGTAFDRNNSTDMVCAWISTDGDDDQYDPNGTAADGGDCDVEQPREAEDNDLTDVVLITWLGRLPTSLDIDPESDTNPANTVHEMTASFTDQVGHPIDLTEGQLVDAEIVSGPNTNMTGGFRDFECPSNSPTENGTCTATYGDQPSFDPANGVDVICFWISTDGDDDQYDPNGTAADGGDCDAETPDETEAGIDPFGNTVEGEKGNDITDSVTATWVVQTFTHDRGIGMKFAHQGGDLVVSGALTVIDGYLNCVGLQPVKIQRRVDGKWDTKATLQTDGEGSYRAELADNPGRYRAIAPRTAHADPDPSKRHVCTGAVKEKVHRH
ncbi:MAG: hypothetical protein M3198_03255 [Actinomycetota bacterium]|nr:hypothetical protein [Actinomycetota bacterium]